MKTAIIGLPQSGKSMIFKALSANPGGSGDGKKHQAGLAEVQVPDERVTLLSELYQPRKTTYATVVLKDLPCEYGQDEAISAANMGELRNSDAITLVIRAFEDEAVTHPNGNVDPAADLDRLIEAMAFADFELADKRMARIAKEGNQSKPEYAVLEKIAAHLGDGKLLGPDYIGENEEKVISGMSFVTARPMMVLANTGEENADLEPLRKKAQDTGLAYFEISGEIEAEIAELPEDERAQFSSDYGLEQPARDRFLQNLYADLDLISFLTVGEDEVRAWTIQRETPAPRAAGKIHSDLERGFIRAEVVFWKDLLEAGNIANVKKQGKFKLEGKSYIVRDGDVLNILFNV